MTNHPTSQRDQQERRWTFFIGPLDPPDPLHGDDQGHSPSPSRGGPGPRQNLTHQLAPTVGPTDSRGPINRDNPVRRTASHFSPSNEGSGEHPQASLERARKGKTPMGGPSQRRTPQPTARDPPKKPIYQRIGKIPAQRRSNSSSKEQTSLSGEEADDIYGSEAQDDGAYQEHGDTSSNEPPPRRGHILPPRTSGMSQRHHSQAVPKKKTPLEKPHSVRDPKKPGLRMEMEELKALMKHLLPEQRLGSSQSPSLPFTKELATAAMPPKFLMPRFQMYNGTGNPHRHLNAFISNMQFHTQDDKVYARAFPQSLEGDAHAWFSRLELNSVDSWSTLTRLFVERHGVTISDEKDETELMEVKQKQGETIREYYLRFTKVAAAIPRVDDHMFRIGFQNGLLYGKLKHSLLVDKARNRSDLAYRIIKYIDSEEAEMRENASRTVGLKDKEDTESKGRLPTSNRPRHPSPDPVPKRKRNWSPRRNDKRGRNPYPKPIALARGNPRPCVAPR